MYDVRTILITFPKTCQRFNLLYVSSCGVQMLVVCVRSICYMGHIPIYIPPYLKQSAHSGKKHPSCDLLSVVHSYPSVISFFLWEDLPDMRENVFTM